jgi:hypothetical protein
VTLGLRGGQKAYPKTLTSPRTHGDQATTLTLARAQTSYTGSLFPNLPCSRMMDFLCSSPSARSVALTSCVPHQDYPEKVIMRPLKRGRCGSAEEEDVVCPFLIFVWLPRAVSIW